MSTAKMNNKSLPLNENAQLVEPDMNSHPAGCGILGKYPVLSVLIFAATGLLVGIGMSTWEPEDSSDKDVAVKWIGLIGDMFIRSLKAVVLPLVFVNVILSMIDMMSVGRASAVGGKTIFLYVFTTFLASITGIISIQCFKGLFKADFVEPSADHRMMFGCDGEEGAYLTHGTNGSVFCTAGNLTDDQSNFFTIEDVDNTFVKSQTGVADITFSDTIYDGVFVKMIPSNIFEEFVNANFAGVVIFAICLGAALSRCLCKMGKNSADSVLVNFLKEVDDVLITLIHWIISITPFAVFSLIASAVGGQNNLANAFSNVAYLCLAVMAGMIVHVFITYTSLLAFFTKANPFDYMRFIIPAQTTAFACASSAATLPVSMQCAADSGKVPASIARFVLPLGASVNMDGSAIYFPCACVWLAVLNGITPTFGNYVLLAFLSTIGSAGAAPVPASGLVMVLTAYNSVFGTTGVPVGFEFVVAIDWYLDRLCTVVNVTGDNVVAASVAYSVALDEYNEDVGEEAERDSAAGHKIPETSATANTTVHTQAISLDDSDDSKDFVNVPLANFGKAEMDFSV